ncbi:MAG: nitrous oxide reductase family maturation protein NosD, partial [Candidatus Wukongarchaeota archaeon]|nr:right-handed parallel beta-helix repeat-containing protein [Candidatus Wukongarchaeota archaeon]
LPDSVSYRFAQRSFLSHTINNFEEPLRGLDYEGGVLIPGISDIMETRAYLGGYYYDSEIGDDIDGIKGRIEIRPFSLLAINVEIRDDNAFETDVLVGGYISIPLPFKGWKDYWKKRGKRKPRERMTDLVVRDIDVVSNKNTKDLGESKVYDMVYVDNRNTTGIEDGSLDHPYKEMDDGLSNLSDGETLYVFQGSGNYTGNFTVSDQNTIIWGEGYEAFPGCGGVGYPVLDGNASGDVITVSANNVEIRGLKIQNSGSRGIYAENRNGGNIHHNILTNNGSGLSVWSILAGNTVSNWTVANNTISNNSGYGIYFFGKENLSNFVFAKNRLSNNGYGFKMLIQSTPTISNFTFTNNTITGNTGYGIEINEGSIAGSNADFNNFNFGDASAGTGGYNSIYNNDTADFYEWTDDTFTAQNNYWGGGGPTVIGTLTFIPYLTSDPNQ